MPPGHRACESPHRATPNAGRRSIRAVSIFFASWMILGLTACDDEPGPGEVDTGCIDPIFCPDVGDAGGDTTTDTPVDDVSDEGCLDDEACAGNSYCDLETGDCVEGCRIDPDNCTGTCEVCNPETHECEIDTECPLYCEADDGCGNDQYCDTDLNICRTGCRIDSPNCPDSSLAYCCDANQSCDPTSHSCIDDPCESDIQCPVLEFCAIAEPPEESECLSGCRTDPDNCSTTWRAGATTVCDPELRSCVEIDCDGDDELCPSGYVCESDLCRVGCRSADDCEQDQPCNPITRRCECDNDEQCSEETICEDKECVDRCIDNDDCRGSTPYCNVETGRCFSECNNESSEPNDSRLGGDQVDSDSFFGGVICGVDIDWYRLTSNSGETIRLTFTFDPGTIDVSAQYGSADPFLTATKTSEDGADTLVVEIPAEQDDWVYVEVSGEGTTDVDSGGHYLGYVVEVIRFPTGACEPDGREDDDDIDGAVALDVGTLENLTLCATDAGDFSTLSLAADKRATITLDYESTDGSLNLVLFDDTRLEAERSADGDGTERILVGPYPVATEWYVSVQGDTPGTDEASYSLALALSDVTACLPDDEEDNDVEGEATPSLATIDDSTTFNTLTACSGDPDWFSINGLEEGEISVVLTQTSGRMLRTGIVQQGSGTVIVTPADSDAATQPIDTGILAASGTYLFHVEDVDSDTSVDGANYSVTFSVTPPDCDDSYEPDDPIGEATSVIDEATTSFDSDEGDQLVACPDNSDYFAIDMTRDGTFSATLTAAKHSANLLVDLLDSTEDSVASAQPIPDTQLHIASRRITAGTYTLHVRPDDFLPLAGQSYRLEVDVVLDAETCDDEGTEPNDLPGEATLANGPISDQRLCPGDIDYWLINVPSPSEVTVSYEFDVASPGVVVSLWDPITGGGELVTEKTVFAAMDNITGDFLVNQALFVVQETAGGVATGGQGYDFSFPQPLPCLDDEYDDTPYVNDSFDASDTPSLELDTPYDVVACPADDDFYQFTVPAGDFVVTVYHDANFPSVDVYKWTGTGDDLDLLSLDHSSDGFTETLSGTLASETVVVPKVYGATGRFDYTVEVSVTE